jgi:hypothetical protein
MSDKMLKGEQLLLLHLSTHTCLLKQSLPIQNRELLAWIANRANKRPFYYQLEMNYFRFRLLLRIIENVQQTRGFLPLIWGSDPLVSFASLIQLYFQISSFFRFASKRSKSLIKLIKSIFDLHGNKKSFFKELKEIL